MPSLLCIICILSLLLTSPPPLQSSTSGIVPSRMVSVVTHRLQMKRGTGSEEAVVHHLSRQDQTPTIRWDLVGVSQNLSSGTNDSLCYNLLKSLLLIGYQQICHWFLSFVIEKRLCETGPRYNIFTPRELHKIRTVMIIIIVIGISIAPSI